MTDATPEKLFETAFALIEERGWGALTLAALAAAAEMEKPAVYKIAPTKFALMDAFTRHIDAEVLAIGLEDDPEETAKDRLFEVMMRRYDLLRPYRLGMDRLVHDLKRRPVDMIAFGPSLMRSMESMLVAAGLPGEGCKGLVRAKGLAAIHLSVLQRFLNDDSEDLASTMAALDRALSEAATYATRFRL